jgi:hypothetical protein
MGMIGNSLAQGLISGANIQDGTVDTPDLKDGAVTTAKHADGSVTNAKMASGAAVANIGYTPFNKAGDTLTGPLDLGGKQVRDTSGSGRVYYNLTPVYDLYSGGSTQGAIVIDTAIPYNASNMCAIKICGYGYNTVLPWELSLSGYFGESNFYSLNAMSMGHPFGSNVRYARKTSTNTMSIILGDTGVVAATSIFVERFIQSYSDQNASYAAGWTISRQTSLSGYQSLTNIPSSQSVEGYFGMYSLNVKNGSQRQIRTWEWSSTLSKNTRYNFMYNNSSYTDVHFILTMEGFHSSRSYAMYGGVFGGYGSQFTNIGGGGTSMVLSQVFLDTGRYYLGVDVGNTPIDPFCNFHMTVFGDTPITLVTGAWY